MGAYYRRMCDSDPAVSLPAARRWSVFEDSTAKLIPDPDLIARSEDDKFAL
jgi:proline iminopeptidase